MYHMIWRETVCRHTTIGTNNVPTSPNLRGKEGACQSPILWERTTDNHFVLKTEPNKTFQTMTQSTLRACVNMIRRLIMIGSSHAQVCRVRSHSETTAGHGRSQAVVPPAGRSSALATLGN